ncbi:MAG: class I SAM-dependent methyltransferase, partial [Nitrospiraceae bacterium]
MGDFSTSRWAHEEFARQYRVNADIYIVERDRMLEIMKSFYRQFSGIGKGHAILDLGCGDGIAAHELLSMDRTASAILLDPSEDMLGRARERMKGCSDVCFLRASFEELLENNRFPVQGFDFIISSQAIHHLAMDDKERLFALIHALLRPSGCFLNIDVVLGGTEPLETWYMKLWEEWMIGKIASLGRRDVSFQDVVRRYKEGSDNKPDTLEDQLQSLTDIGFRD